MAKQLIVSAPLVIFKMDDGSRQHVYTGAPVPDGVDMDHRKQLLDAGMLKEAEAPKTPVADDNSGEDKPPTRSASKAAWVEYATADARGDDKLTEEGANSLTRDQLAEKYLGAAE